MKRELVYDIRIKGEEIGSPEWERKSQRLEDFLNKEGIKESNKLALDDKIIEKTKKMGKKYISNALYLDDDMIVSNMPTGNEEIDKALLFYLRYKDELQLEMVFRYRVKYKRSELRNFPLLLAFINDHWEDEEPFEPFYAYTSCKGCKAETIIQLRDLEVRRKKYKKDIYVVWGYNDDDESKNDFLCFVSAKLRRVLEEFEIKGIEFRPLYYYKNREELDNMYQMRINNAYEYYDVVEYPLGEYKICNECKKAIEIKGHPNFLNGDIDGEIIIKKDLYKGEDIFLLISRFQYDIMPKPELLGYKIISKRLINILFDYNITGFWVMPVHLK